MRNSIKTTETPRACPAWGLYIRVSEEAIRAKSAPQDTSRHQTHRHASSDPVGHKLRSLSVYERSSLVNLLLGVLNLVAQPGDCIESAYMNLVVTRCHSLFEAYQFRHRQVMVLLIGAETEIITRLLFRSQE